MDTLPCQSQKHRFLFVLLNVLIQRFWLKEMHFRYLVNVHKPKNLFHDKSENSQVKLRGSNGNRIRLEMRYHALFHLKLRSNVFNAHRL